MRTEMLIEFAKQYNLTPREADILEAIANYGYSNEQLADVKQIRFKTVANHIRAIHTKTGVTSSRELLAKVVTYVWPSEIESKAK